MNIITHTDDTQHSNAEICSSPAMTSASSQIRPDGPESSESQAVKAQKKWQTANQNDNVFLYIK